MSKPMIPRERCECSAIVDCLPLKLQHNNQIIIGTVANYDVWDMAKPMARQVLPAPTRMLLLPDVANWCRHEYGMRLGAWRPFDLFNPHMCEDYPRLHWNGEQILYSYCTVNPTLGVSK